MIYLNVTDGAHQLLAMINPIQMVERRVKEREDKNQVDEQLILDYGVLIEHYSVKDESKLNHYQSKMRQAIKKSYQTEMKD